MQPGPRHLSLCPESSSRRPSRTIVTTSCRNVRSRRRSWRRIAPWSFVGSVSAMRRVASFWSGPRPALARRRGPLYLVGTPKLLTPKITPLPDAADAPDDRLPGHLVADHVAVLGFAHATLVDQQIGVADHL